jgi:hypothetical protein
VDEVVQAGKLLHRDVIIGVRQQQQQQQQQQAPA